MNIFDRIHFLHRVWRYRYRRERLGISFLLGRQLTGKTAVDIGAHRGIYSYWMHKKVGSQGAVIAFEPQPELNSYLHKVKKAFGIDQLEITNLGLSSAVGERELFRPQGTHWGAASLEGPQSEKTTSFDIQVTTLDDYFQDHSARPIKFIKCDVEGHEYNVFKGGKQILQKDRPNLLFECFDAQNPECNIFLYLKDLGYDGFCFYRRGFAPISEIGKLRESLHREALVNFVFVPKEESYALRKF